MTSLKSIMQKYLSIAAAANEKSAREPYVGKSKQIDGYFSISRFGKHEVRIDEPASFGGSDLAANPAEIMLAGLAASIEVTCRSWAEFHSIPCGNISTVIKGDLDLRGFMDTDPSVRSGFKSISAEIHLSGPVSRAQRNQLETILNRCCPILDTVRHGSPVHVGINLDAEAANNDKQ